MIGIGKKIREAKKLLDKSGEPYCKDTLDLGIQYAKVNNELFVSVKDITTVLLFAKLSTDTELELDKVIAHIDSSLEKS